MEGGRGHSETVPVISELDKEIPHLPVEITRFRDVLNDYKDKILESLTPHNIDESPNVAQNMNLFDSAGSKIQRLANILEAILSETKDEIDYTNVITIVLSNKHLEEDRNQLMDDIDSIFKVFNHKKVSLDKLRRDDSLRDDCLHYVTNDLKVHMFSLKNQPIN